MGLLTAIKSFLVRSTPGDAVLLPGSRIDWSPRQPLHLASVVNSCLQFVQRNFTEAELVVERFRDRDWVRDSEHSLNQLLARPNAFHTLSEIFSGLLRDYFVEGNAFMWIRRDQLGRPFELWYLPATAIQVETGRTTDELIRSYKYRHGARSVVLSTDEVAHFRCGLNIDNPALGSSPLAAVLREIAADGEIITYIVSILRNLGVPGAVISPKSESVFISSEQAELVKTLYQRRTSGDERGQALVMTTPVQVDYPSVSPENLAISKLHRLPETRVASAFGLPPAVAGLLVGLEETATYNNIREAREAAWEECLLPLQRAWSKTLNRLLVSESDVRVTFDTRSIRALQVDRAQLTTQINSAVQSGWLTIAEARQMFGLEANESQHVFLRPTSVAEWNEAGGSEIEL